MVDRNGSRWLAVARHVHQELSFPGAVIDRTSRARWLEEGAGTLLERAAAVVAASAPAPAAADPLPAGETILARVEMSRNGRWASMNVRELRRSAALNPSINVDDTIRRWQRESYANLVNTFRHELVQQS